MKAAIGGKYGATDPAVDGLLLGRHREPPLVAEGYRGKKPPVGDYGATDTGLGRHRQPPPVAEELPEKGSPRSGKCRSPLLQLKGLAENR